MDGCPESALSLDDRIIVRDEDRCLLHLNCVEICPSVFVFNDDEVKAYVIDGANGDEDCVDEAIASCPVECISKE